jgi:hypothetical protein
MQMGFDASAAGFDLSLQAEKRVRSLRKREALG